MSSIYTCIWHTIELLRPKEVQCHNNCEFVYVAHFVQWRFEQTKTWALNHGSASRPLSGNKDIVLQWITLDQAHLPLELARTDICSNKQVRFQHAPVPWSEVFGHPQTDPEQFDLRWVNLLLVDVEVGAVVELDWLLAGGQWYGEQESQEGGSPLRRPDDLYVLMNVEK